MQITNKTGSNTRCEADTKNDVSQFEFHKVMYCQFKVPTLNCIVSEIAATNTVTTSATVLAA